MASYSKVHPVPNLGGLFWSAQHLHPEVSLVLDHTIDLKSFVMFIQFSSFLFRAQGVNPHADLKDPFLSSVLSLTFPHGPSLFDMLPSKRRP